MHGFIPPGLFAARLSRSQVPQLCRCWSQPALFCGTRSTASPIDCPADSFTAKKRPMHVKVCGMTDIDQLYLLEDLYVADIKDTAKMKAFLHELHQ
jgi:hypothetical protein